MDLYTITQVGWMSLVRKDFVQFNDLISLRFSSLMEWSRSKTVQIKYIN